MMLAVMLPPSTYAGHLGDPTATAIESDIGTGSNMLLLTIQSAFALSCPELYSGWNPPPDGLLPSNGEVVFIQESGVDPDVEDVIHLGILEDGITFYGAGPEARVEARSEDTWALVPLEPLEPDTVYLPGVFSMGDEPDHTPPTPPVATATRHIGDVPESLGGGSIDYLAVELDGVEAHIEVEITEANGTVHRLHRAESFSFGTGGCVTLGYPMGTAELSVRARGFDWAGNASDWVDVPVLGDEPDTSVAVQPAACASGRGVPTPFLLAVLPLLVARRARDRGDVSP